ncbi:MAG: ATP-binding protein, partial [Bacilli bacterium]
MKQLVKIKLINWHLFSNEEVIIDGNTILTGENGSGKSTLLDALQYVLTAGKMNFNSAANDANKRTINSYIRGKLGIENKEFLRNDDVVSHIALEYYEASSKQYQVIGAILSLNSTNTRKETFYQIINAQISDDYYIKGSKVNDYIAFKKQLQLANIKVIIKDTKVETRALFRQALGVDKHYFDLVPKALAFKPINELYKFIFSFLLNEEHIVIDKLRNNIRRYRELDNTLKANEERMKYLEAIDLSYQKYQKQNEKLDYTRTKLVCLNVKYLEIQLDNNRQQVVNNNAQLDIIKINVGHLNSEVDAFTNEEFNLKAALAENETYKYKLELEQHLKNLNVTLNNTKTKYLRFQSNLKEEILLLKKLGYKNDLTQALKDDDTNIMSKQLSNLNEKIKDNKESYTKEQVLLEYEYRKNNDLLQTTQKQLKSLLNNRFDYNQSVSLLIKLLNEKLSTKYLKDISIKPLCEYVEVLDEHWRNALEGYLNTQRFDLIVEDEYFNEAIIIYNEAKQEHTLYGVGLVDGAKLKEQEVNINSLSSKVKASTKLSQKYLNYLLNKVIIEEDVTKLNKHNRAISSSCMVYQNYTIRAINKAIYQKPYLGQEAIKIQIKMLEEDIKKQESLIQSQRIKLDQINQNIKLLNESKGYYLINELNLVDEYLNVLSQVTDHQNKLNQIIQDPTWLTIEETLKKVIIQKQELILKVDKLNEQKYQISTSNNLLEVSIIEQTKQLQQYTYKLDELSSTKSSLVYQINQELINQKGSFYEAEIK